MPLRSAVTKLTRTNCVEVVLGAFQSNGLVKALIFLPGATDEFYIFRRAQAELSASSPTLLDAVAALTNQTRIRATFSPPFLLLHTDTDPLEPEISIRHLPAAQRLRTQKRLPHIEFNDLEWDRIQPLLKKKVHSDIQPWRYSSDSYHFYRCAICAWDLTDFELLEALSLASQTRFSVEKQSILGYGEALIRFENDLRAGQKIAK